MTMKRFKQPKDPKVMAAFFDQIKRYKETLNSRGACRVYVDEFTRHMALTVDKEQVSTTINEYWLIEDELRIAAKFLLTLGNYSTVSPTSSAKEGDLLEVMS